METTDLSSVEAAKWVWESLWSAKRHAKVDILDTALFDDEINTDATATLSRWLFTAKDGRVMKKTSISSSVSALKQALLGRVLRGIPDGDRDSRVAGNAPGRVFANALLRSGKSVPLDEEAWTSLVVGGGWHGGNIAAVTALVPTNDSSGLRRGCRQRVICEHRVTVGRSNVKSVDHNSAKPLHASMQTYVIVSSSLLRQMGDQNQLCEQNGDFVADKAFVDGRLLSKSKTTNHEVEAKMHCIVQWVQEVRRVYVLSMTAAFIVLPSTGNNSPRAWLERALDIHIVPKNSPSEQRAPIAGTSPIPPKRSFQGTDDRKSRASRCAINIGLSDKLEDAAPNTLGATSSRQWGDLTYDDTSQTKSALADASEVADAPHTPSDSGNCRSTSITSASNSAISSEVQSTAEILFAATDSTPPTPEVMEVSQPQKSDNILQPHQDRDEKPSTIASSSCCHQPEYSAACPDSTRGSCAGDFCAFQDQSKPSQPKPTARGRSEAGGVAQVDWADIDVSSGNGILLETSKRSTPQNEDGRNNAMFPLSFDSIGLARVEANEGHDLYWDKSLRKYWKEGRNRAFGVQRLGPASAHGEALVCCACYEVYGRLEKLREQVGHSRGAQEPRGGDMLSVMEGIVESNRRAAAAEVGAVRLSTEVTAMLKEVDAKSGKPGIETGKNWRKILSKSKRSCGLELGTARGQAVLTSILAQLRSKPKTCRGEKNDVTPTLGDKMRVKNQGDTPDQVDKPCRSRASARCSFPALQRRRNPDHPRRQGAGLNSHKRAEGDISGRTSLPRGKLRQMAWSHRKYAVGGDITGGHGGRITSQLHSVRGESPGVVDSSVGRESRTTIRAIEAMLQRGGESYLPTCARDLPEATAVLDFRSKSSSDKGDEEEGRRRRMEGHTRRSRGISKEKSSGDKGRLNPRGSEVLDMMDFVKRSERRASGRFPEERFLHPWQRSLEAVKRSTGRTAEYEAALKRDQHRRREARRAAEESKYCQRARERIAARLGRRRRRSHRRKCSGERVGGLNLSRKREKDKPQIDGEGRNYSGLYSINESRNMNGSARPGSRKKFGSDENPPGDVDCVAQMRESLGWARKTLRALLKRLRRKGLAVEDARRVDEAQHGEVVRLVNELQKHLAAFKHIGSILGAEEAALASSANGGDKTASPQSGCDAACEVFETEFSRMVDELTSAAKIHLYDPESTSLDTVQSCSEPCADRLRLEIRSPSRPPTKITPRIRISCFGMCSSCSVLPVARRCLDCKGDGADRDRCAGCFVLEHREATRRNHRFLRISGERVPRTATTTHGIERTGQTTAVQGEEVEAHANSTRCSRCDDLAAARHCRDCGADMCAACHFLAHRTPSRQAHVTEFVGETAVVMQEALYQRVRAASIQEGGGAVEESFPQTTSPASERSEGQTGDVGNNAPQVIRWDTGRAALQQSLVEGRRTVSAPLVHHIHTSPSSRHGRPSEITQQVSDGGSGDSRWNGECEEDGPSGGGSGCLGARMKGNGVEAGACSQKDVENTNGIDINVSASVRGDQHAEREEIMVDETKEDASERQARRNSNSDGLFCSSEEDDSDEGMVSVVGFFRCTISQRVKRPALGVVFT